MSSVALPYPQPANTGQYAADQVAALGAPVNDTDVYVMSAWDQSESPTFPGYNGLGTTIKLPGSTTVPGNSAGVQEYPNLEEGLEATVAMLGGSGQQQALAPQFVTDLRTGTATEQTLVNDIYASNWSGTGSTPGDAQAVASKLASTQFSPAGSPAAQTGIALDSFLFPGGLADPLNWSAISSAAGAAGDAKSDITNAGSSIASDAKTIGIYAGVGIAGAAMILLGIRSASAGRNPRQTTIQGGDVAGLAELAA